MGHVILKDILIIFAVAIPVVLIAHRLKFPSIVGFLITGFIIGPHALRLVPDIEEIRVLAEVGVALLLFSIGLEFSFERLKGWLKPAVGIGTVQVVVTALAAFFTGKLFGLKNAESAILGAGIALSSTAIVMAVLSHKRWFDAPAGRIATGILILQDLAVIPIMVALKIFFFSEGTNSGGNGMLGAALKVIILAVAIFVLTRWVLQPALQYIARPRSKELFVVAVVGLAIGAAYVTEVMGLSFALGAFLAGLIVSTTDFRFHALSEIAPFRYCFNGLFFVTVGMLVDPRFIADNAWNIAFLVAFIIVAKAFIVSGSILMFGYPLSVAVIGGIMLAQVGEFSFMLVFFAWQAHAIGFKFYQVIVDAAAITMVIAPFLVLVAPKIGERLSFIAWRVKPLRGFWQEDVPDEVERPRDHAIICGFGPLGMTIGKILDKHGVKYVVLELNPQTAEKVKKAGGHAYVGDGASAALLHHSGISEARLLAIAVPDQLNAMAIVEQARSMNEKIFIIVRSRYRDQVQGFYNSGADIVICEELEAGIEMGRYIMEKLGMPPEEVTKLFCEVRSFGSADFF